MIDDSKGYLASLARVLACLSFRVAWRMLGAGHSVGWSAMTARSPNTNAHKTLVFLACDEEAEKAYAVLKGAGLLCEADIGLGDPKLQSSPFANGVGVVDVNEELTWDSLVKGDRALPTAAPVATGSNGQGAAILTDAYGRPCLVGGGGSAPDGNVGRVERRIAKELREAAAHREEHGDIVEPRALRNFADGLDPEGAES